MSSGTGRSDDEWGKLFEERFSAISGLLSAELEPELAPLATVTNSGDPKLAAAIDHTLLKPYATPEQIDLLCEEAIRFGFKVRRESAFSRKSRSEAGFEYAVLLRQWNLC